MTQTGLARRVGLNTGLVMGSEVLRKLLALALQLIAVRAFGDAGYGRYTFAVGFVALWALGNDLGLAELTVRDVARQSERAPGYLVDVLSLKLIFGLLALGALTLVVGRTQPAELSMIVWAGLGAIIFAGSREAALGVLKGAQDFRTLFRLNLIGDLLTLGLGFAAVILGKGPEGLIVATSAAAALSSLVSLLWTRKRFGSARPRPRRWWKLIKAGLPFALASVFIIFYKLIDVSMLKYMIGRDEVVGWYGAGVRLYNVLLFLPAALSAALFPALAELAGDRPRLTRATSAGVRLLLAFALPAGLLFFFQAGPLISLTLGDQYGPTAPALRILGLTLPLVFAGYPLATLLKSTGGERTFAGISLGGGVVNILTNLYAIPRWEHVGAAATTLLTEALVLIAFIVAARSKLGKTGLARPLAATMLSGALYGAACYLLPLWGALAALPLYLVLLRLTGAVNAEDLKRLRGIFQRHNAHDDEPDA